MIYTKTRGNPRQGSRFAITVYKPPQECRLHSLKSPAKSSSRSSKSRQSKLVVNLKIIVKNVFLYMYIFLMSIKSYTQAIVFTFFVAVTWFECSKLFQFNEISIYVVTVLLMAMVRRIFLRRFNGDCNSTSTLIPRLIKQGHMCFTGDGMPNVKVKYMRRKIGTINILVHT